MIPQPIRRLHPGRRLPALLIPCLAALGAAFAPPQETGTEKTFALENGLKVILLERRAVPLINVVAAVNAGSKDETDATSGAAHLLEHAILFRGTEGRSGGDVARDVRRHGAYFNAHTGQDLAVFELSAPAAEAEFALRNQKDLLFNLKLDPEELEAEKKVILEEIKQIEDDPLRYGAALAYQNLFAGHPYGRPVYGAVERLKALTADDLAGFHRRLYSPANMALAVVGDFRLSEMEARVREVFGAVPKSDLPPAPVIKPAVPARTIDIEIERDVQEAYLVIAATGPDYNDADQYAGDVLAQAVGQGVNPMLVGALRGGRRDLVNGAAVSYIALRRAGVFLVYFSLEEKNLGAAKREAVAYLRRLRGENFAATDFIDTQQRAAAFDHLESAKNQIRFAVERAWESGLGLASSLAMHAMLSDSEAKIAYLERVAALKPPDMRKTAGKYFGRAEFVIIAVKPKKA